MIIRGHLLLFIYLFVHLDGHNELWHECSVARSFHRRFPVTFLPIVSRIFDGPLVEKQGILILSGCSDENMTGRQRKLSKMIRTKWNVNQELVLVLTWAGGRRQSSPQMNIKCFNSRDNPSFLNSPPRLWRRKSRRHSSSCPGFFSLGQTAAPPLSAADVGGQGH